MADGTGASASAEIPRPMIVVAADFPVFQDRIHGGLQRKLRSLLEAFAREGLVTLFCGAGSDLSVAGCRTVPAFTHDGVLDDAGQRAFAAEAAGASCIVSFETALAGELPAPAMLVLGGLAYGWSGEVVASRAWDCIVVPSAFARRQLERMGRDGHVIPNGYDWTEFRRVSPGPDLQRLRSAGRVLISPHRPEAVKGHHEAVLVTEELLQRGVDCSLLIPEQHFLPRDGDFYRDLRLWAKGRLPADRLIFHPWIPAARMAEYYSLADLTLSLGEVEEGFGAFAVESVGCGTPVLSTDRGAVGELLPHGHGLHLSARGGVREFASIAERVFSSTPDARQKELDRGRAYLKAHYDVEAMARAYLRRIREVAVRFGAEPDPEAEEP